MIRQSAVALISLTFGGLSVSCVAVHRDAGFGDVQATIRQRSGFETHWERQDRAESAVQERLRALLEQEMTDDEAVEIALLNNRRLQATFEELGIARADLLEARLVRNPVLGFEIRYPDRPFEIALTQSILDLITLRKRLHVAAASFLATKLRVTNQVLDMVADVRIAFFGLQAAEQMRSSRKAIAETARVSAELAIRQHEAGNISDLDLENQQAMLEQAKLDLALSESEVLDLRERLNTLMGLWGPNTVWRIASRLPDLPPTESDLSGLESLAVSQRLDLAAARQDVEAAGRAVGLARPEAIGEIIAGVHREREPEGTSSTGLVVDFPIPVFNRGKARKLRAVALLHRAADRYAALAVEIRAGVRAARNRVLLAHSRTEYYRDVIVPRRQRIVAYSQQQYNFMLMDTFELLHAKRNEITADQEYVESLRDYWMAKAELVRAVGGTLTPPGSGPVDEAVSGHAEEPATEDAQTDPYRGGREE